jgi:hypothetical protein
VVRDFSEDVSTSAVRADTDDWDTRSKPNESFLSIILVSDPLALRSLRRNDVIVETWSKRKR